MKITVLDKATLGADIDLAPLYACGTVTEYDITPPELVGERIADTDVVVINKIKLGGDNLPYAKSLKLICVAATGYDNIDLNYCKANNIALCNVPGYSTDSVAQLTLSMALSLCTNLFSYREFVNSGEYTRSGIANKLTPVYHEIAGKTFGIVGGGKIASRVAQVASALGCKVIMCRRKNEGDYPLCDIDTLCRESDIISLHLPLSDSTRGLISRERIDSMKKGAIVINTARGAICDEGALADAVLSGKLGGLGIDVYSQEPFSADHPYNKILRLDNVCLTPHMAWGAYQSRNRCVSIMAKNIEMFFNSTPQNRIV